MASDDLSKALKDARIAALFAFGCVVLVGLLLLIDGQRNKVMLEHVTDARRILEEFRVGVSEAVRDAGIEPQAAAVGGVPADISGAGGDVPAGVVADGAAGAGVDKAGGKAAAPVGGSGGRRAGMAGGPRGNG